MTSKPKGPIVRCEVITSEARAKVTADMWRNDDLWAKERTVRIYRRTVRVDGLGLDVFVVISREKVAP